MSSPANEAIQAIARGANVHAACNAAKGMTPGLLHEMTRRNPLLEMQLLDAFWKGKAIRDRKLARR